jgi:hypothetical protein
MTELHDRMSMLTASAAQGIEKMLDTRWGRLHFPETTVLVKSSLVACVVKDGKALFTITVKRAD